ncbi:protein NPAT isoform X2 [Eucyclogobius newberryi]|uniref:protein NPAT isoform X2 n=1 Tax=Eucyclogobius newberryi TaxID=166745 RepID=UPI003B5BA39A
MLLPSDVARLVLGYLQEEGLSNTSRAFIHESPNLKEYAEHSSEDGTIPACVFSIFGKGLTTILNEYVAVKTKDSNHQVPPMMSSLWKKLDFTLNQIKSLQNSPALSACQRVRSRVGLANIARQRALAPTGVVCTTVSETISIVSPAQTSHCILAHSTPVSYSGPLRLTPNSAPQLQSHEANRLLNTPRDSPVNVTENRLNPAPMSPGRRKWKRIGALSGSAGSSRPVPIGGLALEEETAEMVDDNFPVIIQNAREKILGDRSMQEKLAENINKILSSEPTPQSSKAATNMMEPDQSIDEILGLQAEIHMSDDAIHDILEQTESDPAFQALFDLFECNKTKSADGETADGDMSSRSDGVDPLGPGPSSVVRSVDSGAIQKEALDPLSVKTKAVVVERKTRKSAPSLKKTVIGPCNRSSRIENSSARLLPVFGGQEPQRISSTKRTEKCPPYSDTATPMDIDEPQAAIAAMPTNISTTFVSPTSVSAASDPNTKSPLLITVNSMMSETPNIRRHENKDSPTSNQKDGSTTPLPVPSSSPSRQFPNGGTETQICPAYPVSSETLTASPTTVTSTVSPSTNCVGPTTSTSPVCVSSSTSMTAPISPVPSPPLTASTNELNASSKTAADPNNIMSLKIIISDNQEEDSAANTALSHTISSISKDKIPTIFLSSPAKPPSVHGTPKSGLDEAAQAVKCLQRSETVIASPLTGTSQPQQSYIIQLPFDGATTTAASYFLLTEPPAADAQNRQKIVPAPVSRGQAIAPTQFGVAPQSQGFTTGSTLILPSPMKPVVLPYSVMGQNTLGNIQMVPNQLVAMASPPMVQQSNTLRPLPAGGANPSITSSSEKNVVPPSAPGPGTQSASASPSSVHRRILCFDSSGESQTSKISASSSASSTQALPSKSPRKKPAILTSNKPKRRIVTVRCSDSTAPQQIQEAAKKGSRKQEYKVCNEESGGSRNIIDVTKPSDSRRKSSDRKQNHETGEDNNREKESHTSRSVSSDSAQKSGSRKDKEAADKAKTREGRTEKRAQEITSVTANKENELKGSVQEQSATSSTAPTQSNTQSKSSKPPSKASVLAKKAAEMLQDFQALNPSSTPKGADLSSQEESGSDCPKTPTRTRKSRDAEGTPRHLMPPNSSDIPTCSPASEAGSESSINMAAHTLMILSRAALARTGTPLKNSLRQEGAGEQSPTTSKVTKKRKQSTPTSSPPAKKEAKRTPSKKKERKKLVECFPQDLDVDKFLSSLHYDE